jgi:hypothetical protein
VGPRASGGDGGVSAALARLQDWEDAGAVWRVAELTEDHAIVELCACTGERVDRLESRDPELLAVLRRRPSSEAPR